MRSLYLSALVMCIALCTASPVRAQLGTAFTYQGSLEVSGQPYTGTADFLFEMWTAATGGTSLNATVAIAVQVRRGVFTAQVDYGTSYFNGSPRFLAISVRAPSATGSYVALAGRQAIAPAPYAFALPNVVPNGPNVGIGTPTPSAKLHVLDSVSNIVGIFQSPSVAGAWLGLRNTSVGGETWNLISTGSGNTEGAGKLLLHDASAGPRMTLDAAGNVGIGTTNPASRLDVIGLTRTTALDVTNGSIAKGGVAAASDLGLYSFPFGSPLRIVANSGPIWFFTNSISGTSVAPIPNSQAMTISGGRVGIGTPSPQTTLNVVGAIRHASDATANPVNTIDITSGVANEVTANNDLYINAVGGRRHILLNAEPGSANVGIGTANPSERLTVNGNIRAKVIIIEGGADLAESYDVAPAADTKPIAGMVVAIDPNRIGKLRVATAAYDHTVAGIISGADNIAPGLILGQKGTLADGELPIANVGRVWCYVDADANGPVVPGDLLTTSATPGHAMKASDRTLAGGTTLGKAMSRLDKGKGLVLVLVTLQ